MPGGGYTAIPLDLTGLSTAVCLTPLGITQQKFYNVPVPVVAGTPVVDRATYSLYVRNNVDDASGDATVDNDGIINVVSVGTVTLTAGTDADAHSRGAAPAHDGRRLRKQPEEPERGRDRHRPEEGPLMRRAPFRIPDRLRRGLRVPAPAP